MSPRAASRFGTEWRLAAMLLPGLLLWETGGWDLQVMLAIGDASGFAWRDAWLLKRLLHDGGHALAWAVLLAMAVAAALAARLGSFAGASGRAWVAWLLVALACSAAVAALKQASLTSCPWELGLFGGHAEFVPHAAAWFARRTDGGPGGCFPSGHASTAFAGLALVFLWRQRRPGLARRALAAVLLLGVASAATQVLRGAHYPSHVLWTAWICLVVCTLAAVLESQWRAWKNASNLRRRRVRAEAAEAPN